MGRSLFGNLLRNGVAAATNVFLLVLAAVAARYLGPEDFGIFSFALAFVFFFDIIPDPGLYHLLIREIARDRGETARFVRHGMTWKVVASPVAFVLIAVGVNLLHDSPRIHHAVYLMAIAALLKSAKDVYRSALIANERFGLEAISAVLERGGLLAVGVWVLIQDFGLIGLCWTFVAVRAIDLLVIRQMTVAISRPSSRVIDWRFLKSLIWAGVPIGALYVTYNIYNYVDTVMISVLRSQTETGWYGASFRVYEGLRMIPDVIGTVLLPRLSRAYVAGTNGFAQLVSGAYRYVFFLGLLVAGVGALLSADVIHLIFGGDYDPAAAALSILLVGVPLVFIVHLLQMVLIAMDRQSLLLRVALFGLAANVALNAVAIPLYGYLGAAVTTVTVVAIVCAVLSLIAYRAGVLSGVFRKLISALGCGLAAGALALGPLASLPRYLQAAVFATAFTGLLWLFKVVKTTEWAVLRGREKEGGSDA